MTDHALQLPLIFFGSSIRSIWPCWVAVLWALFSKADATEGLTWCRKLRVTPHVYLDVYWLSFISTTSSVLAQMLHISVLEHLVFLRSLSVLQTQHFMNPTTWTMHNTLRRRESLELSAAIRLQEIFSEGSNDIEKHLATCSKLKWNFKCLTLWHW